MFSGGLGHTWFSPPPISQNWPAGPIYIRRQSGPLSQRVETWGKGGHALNYGTVWDGGRACAFVFSTLFTTLISNIFVTLNQWVVRKQVTLRVLISSPKILDFWSNCASRLAFKPWLDKLLGVLLLVICIGLEANQNWSCYGIFERHSFCQVFVKLAQWETKSWGMRLPLFGTPKQAFSQAAIQPSKGRPLLRNGRFSTACFGPQFTNFCA